MLHNQWSQIEAIVFKLSLVAGVLFYLVLGCIIFIENIRFTQGLDPAFDSLFQNFMVLYTCGNFAFFLEMTAKMTDMDGTAEMQSRYTILSSSEPSEASPKKKPNKSFETKPTIDNINNERSWDVFDVQNAS